MALSFLSATDVAIARAFKAGTLKLEARHNARLDSAYVAISDDAGLIEVALSMPEAEARVREVTQ